ncbi:MAG: hypothetical protein RL685_4934 [Pseudomonadota bacterium]
MVTRGVARARATGDADGPGAQQAWIARRPRIDEPQEREALQMLAGAAHIEKTAIGYCVREGADDEHGAKIPSAPAH